MSIIVETSSGRVSGAAESDIYSFRGVPYGAHSGYPLRFMAPRPYEWTGIRDAVTFGPKSPQNTTLEPRSHLDWLHDSTRPGEDCLVLNIFTGSLSQTSRRPVMVYLHGGSFASGSSGAPGLDGSNLARRDTIVVTLNHRLNVFGFLYLGDADGGRYADSANAGLLDVVAALEWIKQNISRFGGDPTNVTIFGQSGGGSKVAALMTMPLARGLFHRAIIQSASSLLRFSTVDEAERNAHHFLAQFGTGPGRLRTIHGLPHETLLKAMLQAIRAAGNVDNYRPVVDGKSIVSQPFDFIALPLSADVPVLIGWCENEQRLKYAQSSSVYNYSAALALERTADALDITVSEASVLMDAYRSGRPNDTPGDLFAQIVGDFRYRNNLTLAAERRLTQDCAPLYMYLLKWKTPVLNGLLRSPHTLCLPFAFGNVDIARGLTGEEASRYALQDEMSRAWASFAHDGNPNHPGLPSWSSYSTIHRSTMVFDRQSSLVADPSREERLALSAYAYIPAKWEGKLR